MKYLDISKEDLASLLRQHNLTIKFTKKDGSERVMLCTLRPEIVAPFFKDTISSETKVKVTDNINVIDLESKQFRIINTKAIISYDIHN